MSEYNALAVILGPAMDGATELDGARYFATAGFTTLPTDALPNVHFAGRIAEDIEYLREVGVVFWGNVQSRTALGAIQMLNGDGGLDALRTVPIQNRTIEIWRGVIGESFDDWTLCGSGVADRAEFPNLDRVVLVPADRGAVLDRPMQSATFDGGDNSAIQGQVKPVLIGSCYSIPAILTHTADLIYDVHDEAPDNIDRVRFNGVERTETTEWQEQDNGFRALISPESFRVTCDATGNPASSLPETLEYALVDRGALDSTDDLDSTSIGALDTAAPYATGFFADRPVTFKQFMLELMAGFGGGYWFDRNNKLAVGRLVDPDGLTSALTITEASIDLSGTIAVEPDRAPGWSNICAGQRNWYVHQPNEIASSLTDPTYQQIAADLQQDYRVRRAGVGSGSGDDDAALETDRKLASRVSIEADADRRNRNSGIGTLLIDATQIQTEATRWVQLYETRRSFWTVPVLVAQLADAADLEPFQCVTLHLDADPAIPGITGRYGLDTAKKLQVVGIRGRFLSGRVDLRLWG